MQKRYVSVWFPYLATDWFAAKQPALKNTAFVLKGNYQNRSVIKACSKEAQKKGLSIGMHVADARALYPLVQVLDHRPALTTQLLQRIAEWCIRFTPCAAPDEPDGVLLDATGCTHLWGTEEAYLADLVKRLAVRGYTARSAIADTVGAAWALARFGGRSVVNSGAQKEALFHLPAPALRIETLVARRLYSLGLQTVGTFISMPRTALRRRFGAHLVLRIAQALGEVEETFVPITPHQPFAERLPCPEPMTTRSGIDTALEQLLHTLCTRLCKEGKGIRTAVFRCYRADSTAQGIEVTTSRPTQQVEHLFHLFGLKLSTLEPKSGFDLFVLEVTKAEDAAPVQEQLWEAAGQVNNQQLAQLIDRLAGRFGTDAIQRYVPAEHYWPEASYQSTALFANQPALEWRRDKPRPIQVLPVPETIEVTAPIPDYPPMNFRYKGILHTVKKADGPERIEQEWWTQDGEHRDYYAVEDEEGRRYWLFRLGHYSGQKKARWYVHGFFA